jgi:Alginate lyase
VLVPRRLLERQQQHGRRRRPPAAGTAGKSFVVSSGGSSTSGGASGEAGGASASGGSNASGGMSTAGGQGGAGATGGGTAAGGQGGASASIDYSIWVLQLPIGSGTSPTTISSSQLAAGFSNAYFYPASDGGQAFMDPATGITTSGSQHCRTEMRESVAGGGQAAWAASGTNTMTVSGKVLQVGGGTSGTVTVGQVFNGDDSIPLCELQYSTGKGGFELLYEEAKGAGSATDLKTPVALNAPYSFVLALSSRVLTVTLNGKQVYMHTTPREALG